MNPKIKKDWIEALLSEEYNQGQRKLRYEQDGISYYCCLGVLTDLYIKEHKDAEWTKLVHPITGNTSYKYKDTIALLHPDIREWSGIQSDNATLPCNVKIDSDYALTNLNDHGKTFKEIVEIIKDYF